ncbi:hypothetical protein PL321_11490 [Caloramator sp. mosi_1]|uniref:hypothetical protein n=1 Tax=Caloramator sp. mosi_1 TaxID=3023090 RepID=UPI00236129E7|nr:hypothetical protein [Caloramator sp. mosi_1]WDC83375.1 hypothetical protein PL321_11490 [Caloramator sp. mosi_1]
MSKNIKEDLKNSKEDILHTAAKTGLSMIPVFGGVAAEIFSNIIAPPISKRRDEWLIRIYKELENIKSKIQNFDWDSLSQNDNFITIVMHATQTAIKNHNEEKLEALKNAVLNSAIKIEIDENLQLMFINYIDLLTPWHLKIFTYFRNPREWLNERKINIPQFYTTSPANILEIAFPELKGKRNFYDIIIKDLYSKGLLELESLHTTMTESGALTSRTTEIGNKFITYISIPKV